MPITATLVEFNTVSDYVYRCCWMTNQLDNQSLITFAQAQAVLAAWNTAIKAPAGFPQFGLVPAANKTKENLDAWFNLGGALKTQVQLFGTLVLSIFPEQEIQSHPCSNWGVLILDFATTMA